MLGLEIETAFPRAIGKPAIAEVVQQHRPLPARRTAGMPYHVAIGDDEVFPTIVIQIQEPSSRAHVELPNGCDPRCWRTEEEQAVALISVQGVHLVLVVGTPQ